jgi:hypothetical protein
MTMSEHEEQRDEPVPEDRFMSRDEAEADDTIDLHEHDDPKPHYRRLRELGLIR